MNILNKTNQFVKIIYYFERQKFSLLRMAESPIKNLSMQSTMYKSSFFGQKFMDNPQQKKLLPSYSYANVPLQKQTPRWSQSSSTWRHSSHKYSFSKDNRFKVKIPYYLDFLQPQIPSTKSTVSCTFGKGDRRAISSVVLRNAKQKPSPDRYDLNVFNESPRKQHKGKTFGIGWSNFKKIHIDHRKDVYSGHFTDNNPPAHYNVREKPGSNKKKFTAYGRLKMYTEKMAKVTKDVPGPHHSIRDRHLYATKGLNQRNFGFGERINFSKPANQYPGAKYQIPGFCEKFKNLQPNNQ